MSDTTARRVALLADAGSYVGPALARLLAQRGHDLVVGDPADGLVAELAFLDGTSRFTTGQFVAFAGGWV